MSHGIANPKRQSHFYCIGFRRNAGTVPAWEKKSENCLDVVLRVAGQPRRWMRFKGVLIRFVDCPTPKTPLRQSQDGQQENRND